MLARGNRKNMSGERGNEGDEKKKSYWRGCLLLCRLVRGDNHNMSCAFSVTIDIFCIKCVMSIGARCIPAFMT